MSLALSTPTSGRFIQSPQGVPSMNATRFILPSLTPVSALSTRFVSAPVVSPRTLPEQSSSRSFVSNPTPLSILHPTSLVPPSDVESRLVDTRLAASRCLRGIRARKSKDGCSITSSPYRPHVPADRRLFLWTTPYSRVSQQRTDDDIPLHLHSLALSKVANSVVENTRGVYGAGLLRFTQFCDFHSIPESKRMPAPAVLLAAFAASACGTGSAARLKNWMAGLAFWHKVNCAPWHGKDEWVPLILRASIKEGHSFRRPPRGPVTLEHLRALRERIDITTPRGAAIWAAALAAFWGCRRLGELLIRSLATFNPAHDVTRSTSITITETAGRLVISIFLPWTKTTGSQGGRLILTQTGDDLCPVAAFKNHLNVNGSPPPRTPLFAFRNGTTWSHLTKTDFLTSTIKIFQTAGLQHVFGHSYRIGGSVHLLSTGVESEVVMKLGGWSSMCFLIYWRRLEKIIPTALVKAWASRISSFISSHNLASDLEDFESLI